MSPIQRKPYTGDRKRLVVAFDIGTTFSRVAYSILKPGEPPEIHTVTQFPGQQSVGPNSKIPSVICYDASGLVAAVGSETNPDTNPELLEVDGLSRVEWVKLYLRPPLLAAEEGFDTRGLAPLPRDKTAINVFGDILRYLFHATGRYIRDRMGDDVWNSIQVGIHFILSYPNGWEAGQLAEMRRAAMSADLVADAWEALERVRFVAEGEAHLHFCSNWLPRLEGYLSEGVLVADCGTHVTDISTYIRTSGGSFKEVAPPKCLRQGSVFVTKRAFQFLTEKLFGSKYGNPEEIAVMARFFDKNTKMHFKDSSKPCFLRFGSVRDTDPSMDIKAGTIKLSGQVFLSISVSYAV
ncbi:hypothetical protein AX14_013526 [Amanita brunnescens Koide BX004]|nr:hypothetical protein AX14_013526 [Amanita brunnescens Koide BX004]